MLNIDLIPKASLIVLLQELKAVNKQLENSKGVVFDELRTYKCALLEELRNRNVYVRE